MARIGHPRTILIDGNSPERGLFVSQGHDGVEAGSLQRGPPILPSTTLPLLRAPESDQFISSLKSRTQRRGMRYRVQHGRAEFRYGPTHGLTIAMPKPSKSLTFRVTRARSCSRAVAAIIPSGALRGRPPTRRVPSSFPHRTAIDCVIGKMRPGNRCAKWRASDASRRARRTASRMVANPDSISPMLTTLRNNLPIS